VGRGGAAARGARDAGLARTEVRQGVGVGGLLSAGPAGNARRTAPAHRGDNCHPDAYTAHMKTVTVRDFRTRPKQIRDALKREREAVLTVNGRPVAVMIPVDAATIDETLETLRRARALEALRAIRQESRRRDLARMSPRDIDAIVARTRKARSRNRAG